jgi:DNA-binding response OmpR family regulator
MDLRVLVLTADAGMSELLRTQVENLGCHCNLRDTYDGAGSTIDWADAAIIDLADDGLDNLNRLRVEAPRIRILAISPDAAQAEPARSAGAHLVLVEPFSGAEIIDAVRGLAPRPHPSVIDLREGVRQDDGGGSPWFATP